MKNFLSTVSLALCILLISACQEERVPPSNEFQVKFLPLQANGSEAFEVNAKWIKNGTSLSIQSDRLVRKSFFDAKTGKTKWGYFLVDDLAENPESSIMAISTGCTPSITRGYVFDYNSSCLIYGTLIVADDCTTLFLPCGSDCQIALDPICPPEGDQIA